MSVEADHEKLSAFQALIRESLEYFEATDDDVLTSVQGRRQKIRLGQSKFLQTIEQLSMIIDHLPVVVFPRHNSRSAMQVLLPSSNPEYGQGQGSRVLSQDTDQRLPRYVRRNLLLNIPKQSG